MLDRLVAEAMDGDRPDAPWRDSDAVLEAAPDRCLSARCAMRPLAAVTVLARASPRYAELVATLREADQVS
jgi:hypothetical protein